MRAFDFIMTLYSFVYALAVAQILSTIGDMIRAGRRLHFSWLNAGWMLNYLTDDCRLVAEPLGPQDADRVADGHSAGALRRGLPALRIGADGKPPIPPQGTVDLQQYHVEDGRKYAGLFAAECGLTIVTVFLYGAGTNDWFSTNWATLPTMGAAIAAATTNNRWVQAGALLVILPLWIFYFATLQSALS